MKPTRAYVSILLLAFAFAGGWAGQAQRRGDPFPPGSGRDGEHAPNDPRKKLPRRMLRESFQDMQKESGQLVQMSTELRDLLQQTTEDELSLDAMKRAEAIEKLAGKIKNRMKNL